MASSRCQQKNEINFIAFKLIFPLHSLPKLSTYKETARGEAMSETLQNPEIKETGHMQIGGPVRFLTIITVASVILVIARLYGVI